MRGGAGERGAHAAGGDHAVGVAERGDGGFEEEVVRAEGGWGRDGVDFVGLVELETRERGILSAEVEDGKGLGLRGAGESLCSYLDYLGS